MKLIPYIIISLDGSLFIMENKYPSLSSPVMNFNLLIIYHYNDMVLSDKLHANISATWSYERSFLDKNLAQLSQGNVLYNTLNTSESLLHVIDVVLTRNGNNIQNLQLSLNLSPTNTEILHVAHLTNISSLIILFQISCFSIVNSEMMIF